MDRTIAIIFIFLFGLLSLVTGIVILVKKEYFDARLKHKDFIAPAPIWKVSGKRARSDGISSIVIGIFLLVLSIVIYIWGN